MRNCEQCGGVIPAGRRGDARYCCDAHKAAAYKARRRAAARSPFADAPFALAPEQQAALDQATSEVRLVAIVASAARTQWRAAAWLLERRHPQRWAAPASSAREVVRDPDEFDPFAELDELAEARRRKKRPEGY
jgi:hypothetical protein